MTTPPAGRARLDTAGRVPALDGLRGVAILLVVACHFIPQGRPGAVAEYALAGAAFVGHVGVDLFFVLSGFLITGILLDSRDTPDRWRTFAVRRALRIFPLYYATLAALFVVLPAVGVGPDAGGRVYAAFAGRSAWLWTFTVNARMAFGSWRELPPITTPYWSLAAEEQFYLVWPLVVWRVSPRALARVCLGAIVGAPLARAALMATGVVGAGAVALVPFLRVEGMAVGALVALAVRDPARWPGIARAAARATGALAGTAPRLAASAGVGWVALMTLHYGLPPAAVRVLEFPAVALAFGAVLIAALAGSAGGDAAPRTPLARVLECRPLRAWGAYSYAVYLLHGVVWQGVLRALGADALPVLSAAHVPVARHLAAVAVAAAATFALAAVSWRVIEAPALSLRHRLGASSGAPRRAVSLSPAGRPGHG